MACKNFIYTFICVLIPLYFPGCTIIGLSAGSKEDAERAIIKFSNLDRIENVKHDTPVKIQLRDDQVIAGTFQGIEKIDPAEYGQRYGTFRTRQEYNQLFPAINDTITIIRQTDLGTIIEKSKSLFTGFDLSSTCFRSLPDDKFRIENLDSLAVLIDTHGKIMKIRTIKECMEKGIVPLRSELLIQTTGGRQRIPGEKVVQITLPAKITNRVAYALIGLSLDALIFIVIKGSKSPMIDIKNSHF
jgi:hypothetical protein